MNLVTSYISGWSCNLLHIISSATFKVTAGADIYKADGTKVYNKGDVIAENLVSGNEGQAVLSDLHRGTYVVTETKSLDWCFCLCDIEAVADWKVYGVSCLSVSPGGYGLMRQGSFWEPHLR